MLYSKTSLFNLAVASMLKPASSHLISPYWRSFVPSIETLIKLGARSLLFCKQSSPWTKLASTHLILHTTQLSSTNHRPGITTTWHISAWSGDLNVRYISLYINTIIITAVVGRDMFVLEWWGEVEVCARVHVLKSHSVGLARARPCHNTLQCGGDSEAVRSRDLKEYCLTVRFRGLLFSPVS